MDDQSAGKNKKAGKEIHPRAQTVRNIFWGFLTPSIDRPTRVVREENNKRASGILPHGSGGIFLFPQPTHPCPFRQAKQL